MKPHRLDGVSLTFGLIFLGIVVVWLFNQAVSVHLNAGWIVAVGLILFGGLGLLGALRSDKPERGKAGQHGDGLDYDLDAE
ncbi:hypothetical protein ABT369_12970 [Dactylosporangium sp. NPDC000244]|uniref:hypothetical protein n=1 Tax=Dactylosporangium sp. NPDC000244 TaxID=3154365 RepID=UPI00332469BD|nr:hypothetical protein GCM10020063_096270 [Dactylosporangium thailandense]